MTAVSLALPPAADAVPTSTAAGVAAAAEAAAPMRSAGGADLAPMATPLATARGALRDANAALRAAVRAPALTRAINATQTVLGNIGDLGLGRKLRKELAVTLPLLVAAYRRLLKLATTRCRAFDLGDSLALRDVFNRSANSLDALNRKDATALIDAYLPVVERCLAMRLHIDSTFITDVQEVPYVESVAIDVPLTYDFTKARWKGTGDIVITSHVWDPVPSCTTTITYPPGEFSVKDLFVFRDPKTKDARLVLMDTWTATPDGYLPSDDYVTQCPDSPPVEGAMLSWGQMFRLLHVYFKDEKLRLQPGGTGGVLAQRAYRRTATGLASESTVITLRR